MADVTSLSLSWRPLNLSPTTTLLLAFATVTFFWTLTTAIYRLYFHPLSHIPGPLLCRISTLWTCYHDWFRGGQLPFAIQRLHATYGPIIRLTPNEVHVSDPDFLDTIFAMRNRNSPFSGGVMIRQSVGGADDFALHKLRREALNPYFSVRAVNGMEGVLRGKAEKFGEILERFVGQEVNLSNLFFAFSNDAVRAFCFGKDNGLLDDLIEAKTQRENFDRLTTSVPLNVHFPWVGNVLAKALPLVLGEKAIPPAVMDMINFRSTVGKDIEAIFSDDEAQSKPDHSIFYDLRDSKTLPPEEKTKVRLQDEATLLIMAGTGSTAKSLVIAAFYVLYQPGVMTKLREELTHARQSSKVDQIPLNVLLSLPYLNAIIQESHRISFGVTRALTRYAPTETLSYTATSGPNRGTTYALPPGTHLSASTICIHTDESLFSDPWTFDPERWIPSPTHPSRSIEAVNKRKRSMLALGKGHRKCIGLNLANAEMCLALSVFAEYEMKLFETDEGDVKFQRDFQISHPRVGSKGVRVFVEGRCAG